LVASALLAGSSAAAEKLHVEAKAWMLIDARTGETIASHAAARHLPIASTTKLMTAYVALKEMSPRKVVRAAPYEAEYGESLMGLRTGQRISVRDLLYGLDPAQRQRCRPHAGDRRRRLAETLRAADEPPGVGARALRHPLREPDRTRPAGQPSPAPSTWRR